MLELNKIQFHMTAHLDKIKSTDMKHFSDKEFAQTL